MNENAIGKIDCQTILRYILNYEDYLEARKKLEEQLKIAFTGGYLEGVRYFTKRKMELSPYDDESESWTAKDKEMEIEVLKNINFPVLMNDVNVSWISLNAYWKAVIDKAIKKGNKSLIDVKAWLLYKSALSAGDYPTMCCKATNGKSNEVKNFLDFIDKNSVASNIGILRLGYREYLRKGAEDLAIRLTENVISNDRVDPFRRLRAFGALLDLAKQGDSMAEFCISECYDKGFVFDVDKDLAGEWRRMAKEHGCPLAY